MTTGRINSFFCCNGKNTHLLQWEINGVGIGVFKPHNLESVIAGNDTQYYYIASLLSLRNNSGQYTFDSVLVVSAQNGSRIQVNCTSDDGFKTISNLDRPKNTQFIHPQRRLSVSMQPQFLTNSIVVSDNRNINTKAFFCATTNSNDQLWEVHTSNSADHIALSVRNHLGKLRNRLTNSMDTVRIQAISLGQHNQYFTSILYVTDDTVVNVSCLAGGKKVDYPADFKNITTNKGMPVRLIESGLIFIAP